MVVIVETLNNFKVYKGSKIKLKKMGQIAELKYISNCNQKAYTRKINRDEYILLETGEILNYKHSENRSQNVDGIRQSISRLRDLINNNFKGGKNELWITLTFGKNKIYNPKDLCAYFEDFIKRLRYYCKGQKIDYIYVPEPHEKGDWHIHLLLKTNKESFYISNKKLNEIWQNGFVKVNRLKDVDNVGAYVSAYLINIKEGETTKKGARLYLYPTGHRLYRYSRGILPPIVEELEYSEAKKILKKSVCTYEKTIKFETEKGFKNLIKYEHYKFER